MAKKGRYGVSMIKTAFHPVMLMECKSSNMSTGQQKSPHFQRGLSGSCKNNKCIKNQDFLYLLGHSF